MSKQTDQHNPELARQLGALIRARRRAAGLTAAEVADAAGLSRSYLSYLETGHFAEIGVEKLSRVLRTLDLSADEVLAEAGYLPAKPARVLPEPADYLRKTFGLSTKNIKTALGMLQVLTDQQTTLTTGKRV
jgi:transcriptional regulator with XRE-family HTH domain